MRQISKALWLTFAAVALMAAGPSWTNKPVQQWSAEDAKQVLAASPWVGRVAVRVVPPKNEAQLREGGRMGGGTGLGAEALNPANLLGIGGSAEPGKRRATPGRINPV
jgi:hypothetical protein